MTSVPSNEKQRERDITGCLLRKEYGELSQPGVEASVSHFQAECQKPEFAAHWSGFAAPSFHPNTNLTQLIPARDKFVAGLKNLDRSATLGVVFHGTSGGNIGDILQNGLDPRRRKGQAYGPGEYFSKTPSLSVSYCKGGLEILVFVVVLPSTVPGTADDEKKSASKPGTSSSTRLLDRTILPDYVVVENNHHQIPIGTMKFDSVDKRIVSASLTRREQLRALNREVSIAGQVAKETQIKAKIIQDLIADKVDTASRNYQKADAILKMVSKQEISWYVHQKVDEEVICFYFEDLPEPLKPEEMASTKLQNLDEARKQEQEAKTRLEAAEKAALVIKPLPEDKMDKTISGLRARLEMARSTSSMGQSSTTNTSQTAKPRLAMDIVHEANISTLSTISLHAQNVNFLASSLLAQESSANGTASPSMHSSQNAAPSLASLTSSSSSALNPDANRASLIADIIQRLITNQIEMASELYQKHTFDHTAKKEIYLYAKPIVNEDQINVLFPGLVASISSPDECNYKTFVWNGATD